jgi:hypothetical protein
MVYADDGYIMGGSVQTIENNKDTLLVASK